MIGLMEWWKQPFFQVALPIIVTFIVATLYQSKRIDDLRDALNRRIDGLDNSVGRRLDAIERRLENIEHLLSWRTLQRAASRLVSTLGLPR